MSIAEISGIVLDISTERPLGLRPQRQFDKVTIKQNGNNFEIETDVGALSEGDGVLIVISKSAEGEA